MTPKAELKIFKNERGEMAVVLSIVDIPTEEEAIEMCTALRLFLEDTGETAAQ